MKASIEQIHEVLHNNQLAAETIQKVLQEIESAAAAEAQIAAASKEPTVKKQFVLIVSDPRDTLPDVDYVGWVAQIPEDDSPGTTMEKLFRAAYEYNISKKGRKYPVKTVGARYLKEQGLAIKNKTPVTIVRTNNKVPEIEVDFPRS